MNDNRTPRQQLIAQIWEKAVLRSGCKRLTLHSWLNSILIGLIVLQIVASRGVS